MGNNISDLRTVLFDTLQDLKSNKIDVVKAKAITNISQTIINSAKVEIDFLKATKSKKGSEFLAISEGPMMGEDPGEPEPELEVKVQELEEKKKN